MRPEAADVVPHLPLMGHSLDLRAQTLTELRRRRTTLLHRFHLPAGLVHASLVERYLRCGKATCHCQSGSKHGPFYYLTRSFPGGRAQSVLLKGATQVQEARAAVAAYARVLAVLDELSQINFELLRLQASPLDQATPKRQAGRRSR